MNGDKKEEIAEILRNSRNIAVVGISDKPDRDSYRVASYLLKQGYNIIPVNPNLKEWNGRKAFPSLKDIPGDTKIDIVDVFRKSETVVPVAKEAVEVKAKTLWLQEGVVNLEAEKIARENGMNVIMDRCMMKEHMRL